MLHSKLKQTFILWKKLASCCIFQSDVQKPKDPPAQNPRSNFPCRFGDGCTRVGCTFWHTKDGEQTAVEPELVTISHSVTFLQLTFCGTVHFVKFALLFCL
jgi:hypothetical protein